MPGSLQQARQPKGTTRGGQFATQAHTESAGTLTDLTDLTDPNVPDRNPWLAGENDLPPSPPAPVSMPSGAHRATPDEEAALDAADSEQRRETEALSRLDPEWRRHRFVFPNGALESVHYTRGPFKLNDTPDGLPASRVFAEEAPHALLHEAHYVDDLLTDVDDGDGGTIPAWIDYRPDGSVKLERSYPEPGDPDDRGAPRVNITSLFGRDGELASTTHAIGFTRSDTPDGGPGKVTFSPDGSVSSETHYVNGKIQDAPDGTPGVVEYDPDGSIAAVYRYRRGRQTSASLTGSYESWSE